MLTVFNRKVILPALASLLALTCAPAAAKTTVTVEGTTVVIHVPIEVVGMSPNAAVTLPAGTEINGVRIPAETKMSGAEYLQQQAMEIWNKALAGFKWGDCLTFRLDLQIIPISDRKAAHQPGRHHVEFDWEDPPDFLPPDQREVWTSNAWNPTGTDDMVPSLDNSFPFTRDVNGHWYRPDAGTIAHEVGHVLGLGDDYFRTQNPDGTSSVTGRKSSGEMFPGLDAPFSTEDGQQFFPGTFTTSGIGAPTPDAIARVVEQMKAAGLLPQCWKGAMQAKDTAQHGPDQRCEDGWHINLTVVVSAEGQLSGDAKGQRASPVKCNHAFPTSWAEGGIFHLKGQGDKQTLRLKFIYDSSSPAGSIDNGMFALMMGYGTPKTVDIPLVGKDEARGTTQFAWTAGSSVRNGSGKTTLKCTTC